MVGWERKNWSGGKGPGQIRVVSKAMRTEDIRREKKKHPTVVFPKGSRRQARGAPGAHSGCFLSHFCILFSIIFFAQFTGIHYHHLKDSYKHAKMAHLGIVNCII